MIDTLQGQKLVGDGPELECRTIEDHDLETMEVIDVHVRCTDDPAHVPVLKVIQSAVEFPRVMIVDVRQDAEHGPAG